MTIGVISGTASRRTTPEVVPVCPKKLGHAMVGNLRQAQGKCVCMLGGEPVSRARSAKMSVRVAEHEAFIIAFLVGEIDKSTLPDLREKLVDIIQNSPPKHMIVDMSGASAWDSRFLPILAVLYKMLATSGSMIFIAGPCEGLWADFARTGIDRVLTPYETLAEAKLALSRPDKIRRILT